MIELDLVQCPKVYKGLFYTLKKW